MKKLIAVAVFVLCVNGMAQEVAATLDANALPLPESWKGNALIVLAVNFLLAVIAIGVKMLPGKLGEIIGKIVDLLSANVKHTEKK